MSDKPYQFQPGNPGGPGRPPGQRSVETLFRDAIAKIATDQSIEDVERELVITLLAKAKKGDMRALEMYLDRLYGKPKQHIEQKTDLTIIDIHGMSEEEKNKYIATAIKTPVK